MQNYRILDKDIDENGYLIDRYPQEIEGYFVCNNKKLKFLKGVPKKIGGYFNFSHVKIKSLIDGPQWVGKSYICTGTKILSLEGAPQYVGGYFVCADTKISSLEGIGRKFLKEVNEYIGLDYCPIKSNMLGLLLVKNLKVIYFNDNQQLTEIINKHLKADRDVLECQEELINNGFKEYAKL